jgi:hypothetical protein
MQNYLGFLSLLFILVFIIYFTRDKTRIRNFLIIAFTVRGAFLILNAFNLINFPDSNSDTDFYYDKAIEFSRIEGLTIIFDLFKLDSLFYPRLISIFFSIFGESRMMAESIGVAIGTTCVYLIYSLSLALWDERSANKAAWVSALFPSLIIYSILMLKEVYFVFFLLITLHFILNFVNKKSFLSFINLNFGFFFMSLFHGPAIIGSFVFLMYLLFSNFKNQFVNMKINIYFILLFFLSVIPYILYSEGYFQIPYLGAYSSLTDLQFLIEKSNRGFFDSASYPNYLIIDSISSDYFKIIFKIFYFLYSPFIWDINKIIHIFGFLDATLYIIFTICIYKNWKNIWKNPIAKFFLAILAFYVLIYAFGAGNFGTSFRHRSKFVALFIILSAPKLLKFVLKIKKLKN